MLENEDRIRGCAKIRTCAYSWIKGSTQHTNHSCWLLQTWQRRKRQNVRLAIWYIWRLGKSVDLRPVRDCVIVSLFWFHLFFTPFTPRCNPFSTPSLELHSTIKFWHVNAVIIDMSLCLLTPLTRSYACFFLKALILEPSSSMTLINTTNCNGGMRCV